MPSPADREVAVRADVERIAQELYHADEEGQIGSNHPVLPFNLVPKDRQERYRRIVRALLLRDVVRVGKRPEGGPEPLEGQEELPISDRPLFAKTERG